MKQFAQLISAIVVAVLFSANAFAQDLNTVGETFNAANAALKEDKNAEALAGFQKALEGAVALGEEGQAIATDCKSIIPKLIVVLGKESVNNKNYDKALEYFGEAIKLGGEYGVEESVKEAKELSAVVALAKANDMLNEGKFQEAVDEYNKVIAADPNNATAYIRLGMAQAKLNNEAGAVEAFNKAAELGEKANADKQLAGLYTNKAVAAFKAKNNAAALESALKADEYAKNPQVQKIGGIAAFNLKKYDSCVKLLEQVITATPAANDARYYLARAYEALGNKAKALENYKKIASDPKFKAFADSKIAALGA